MEEESLKSKSLSANAIFNTGYKFLNAFFPLISITYISRVLMPSGVGVVSYAQNIASYFITFAALGMPLYGTREIARVRDDLDEKKKLFSELFMINFITTTCCLFIYLLLIINISSFYMQIELYLACGLSIFFNLINVDWFYQGQEEYVYIALRNLITKLIVLILLFIFVKDSNDYVIYAILSSLALGGNYIFNIFNIRKYIKFNIKNVNLKRHWKSVFILGICIVAMDLYHKIDITMLGIWSTDVHIAYYNNAQKLVTLGIILCTAISAVFLPRLSYYFISDKQAYDELISKGINVALFFSVPCFIGIFQVAHNLIPLLFGESFEPAIMTTQILSVLIFLRSIFDLLCYQVILTSGQDKKFIIPYLLVTGVNIILNFFLIPITAENGAAIASVISEVLVNLLLLFTALKVVRVRLNLKYFLTIVISTICMACGVSIVDGTFDSYFFNVCAQVTVGILIYFMANFLLKNEILIKILKKEGNIFE